MRAIKLVLTGLVAVISIATAEAQTVDEIISKYLDAIGGKEKLLALTTITMDAKMSVQGTDIPIKITQVHNKGQRIDINFNGMANYIIQTPTEGWTYMPVQGQTKPEASPETLIKETADGLDVQSPLLNYKAKGHDVVLVGKEDVEGTECFKLKLKMKGGLEQTIFIDPTTYYIIKIISKTKATGQEQEQTQTFSNYKKLDSGYVFPFSMTGFGPGEMTVTKIQVNTPVDEKIFKIN
jgi:hypothetical protein